MKSRSALMAIMATSIGAAMVSRNTRRDEDFEIRVEKPKPESEYVDRHPDSKPVPKAGVSQSDAYRVNAAQAKRDRKAAKRLKDAQRSA